MAYTVITKNMDTDQIQKVLNRGRYIRFEKGVYSIKKTLNIYSNTHIDLGGATLQQGAPINHILLTHSTPTTTGYNGVFNVTIENGILEGMGKYNTKLNLLTLCHSANITVHNVTFKDVVEFHSIEINSSFNVNIRNCNFYGHNTSLDKDDFREQIQIDCAVESALVVVPLGSKWYDGTACDTVTITNCSFSKSSSRPAASQCIGNHCQFSKEKHKRITICNNVFTGGNQVSKGSPCIRLVNMQDVVIANNTCSQYGRFVQVTTYAHTYGLRGKETNLRTSDGVCSNILIRENNIKSPSGSNAAPGIYVTTKTGPHMRLLIEGNKFDFGSLKGKYAIYVKNVNNLELINNDIPSNTKVYQAYIE